MQKMHRSDILARFSHFFELSLENR